VSPVFWARRSSSVTAPITRSRVRRDAEISKAAEGGTTGVGTTSTASILASSLRQFSHTPTPVWRISPGLRRGGPSASALTSSTTALPGSCQLVAAISRASGRPRRRFAWFIVEDGTVVEVVVAQGKLPCDVSPRPKFAEATDKIAALIVKALYGV